VSEKKGGELRKKRELIIFGYKAQEIPLKISLHSSPPVKKISRSIKKL